MSEPTKEKLLAFMRKHGLEKVDSITDTESAIRHFRCTSKIYEEQCNQYKAERDTLIDDIAVLRANNKRLERENEKLKATNENLNNRVRNLNLNGQIQHDELMSCDGEVRYWKDKYTTLTDHIRQKTEANPNVDRYIALVNYIDRLECD
ncbi:hypothetical protein K2V48_07485 [Staphylococcus gallinarum]|uniref:hypothetical protein n=1 Tax=Staphylococcus gallinarum TaxID=1293 RepID=UPI001E3B025D|nr:hypothetical protein [Staphylococcus gallinarum]MCD8821207.1 hypothetical protein [Staphylococcus gallinarum]